MLDILNKKAVFSRLNNLYCELFGSYLQLLNIDSEETVLNLLFLFLCFKKTFLNQDYALPTPLEINLRNRVSVTL